ncbi:ABC transporter substrate-binding protein [Microcoleus sp. FACHB-SPT15]|uniref:ABC transporter substrate-binding protein n=1 Tax=Microcoleus sp. FACHB-SPT15 TaxID=2692830 RepID=UPI001784A961|nr:ABC transporter substrate-binding protein [Microcoleus sp. FACHB-SPT15]MBD1807238.1 ABC transporter substrate-binding protein [Microcoleus sp. FACHB-SPT15]
MSTVLPNLRRWLSVLLTLILWVIPELALGGCNPTELKTEAAQVSQLVLHTISDPKTFNYALKSEFPNIFPFTFEGLTFANEFTGKIEPGLAESWESFDNNQRYIFTLREGLKWSDGVPLTADDVVFTYEEIVFNPEIATDQKDVLKIGTSGTFPKIRRLDERRVEFTLPEPFAPFLRITSGPQDGIVILPKHILRESVITKDASGNPKFASTWGTDANPQEIVVNGAYRIASYTPSQRVVLERNPYYWRKDAQGKPQPYIQRIVWQIVESQETALLQFRSGGLDLTEGWGYMPVEHFGLLKREEKRGKFKLHTAEARPGTLFLSFNLNKGQRKGRPLVDPIKSRWFNSVEFRQAIAYALDRQSMINNTLRGLGELQNSPISLQSPYYISQQEGLKVYDYNPEQSKELLTKAGFKFNDRGQLLDAEGNRVRFTLLTNAENKTRVALGAQIKQNLSQIGIQVDFNPIAFNTLVDKLSNTLDWDSYLLGFTGGVEPHDGANVWLPDGGLHAFNQKPQQGQVPIEGREVYDWEAQIGRLYVEGAKTVDEAKRKAIYAETQRITQEYLPMIYLVNSLSMSAVRDRIQNVKYNALGGVVWNIYELKVSD